MFLDQITLYIPTQGSTLCVKFLVLGDGLIKSPLC